MPEILEIQNPGWIYFYNPKAVQNKEKLEIEAEKPNYGTLGKYLFFSDDKEALVRLAKELLQKYDLYSAKVPKSNNPKPSPGFGFVLCVYDSHPGLKHELRQYGDEKTIKYRYWKSDAATSQGKYSKEYLATRKLSQ